MTKKIGIVMDPIETITPYKDSTLALMLAAQKSGAELYYMVSDDLYIQDGHAYAAMGPLKVSDNLEKYYDLGETLYCKPLTDLDIVLMRKDPPVDKRFLHTCAMLEQAVRDGVRVINNPTMLITNNEKLYATQFPEFCPPTLITSCNELLRGFRDKHEKIIIKPLDSMGGDGVFMVTKDDVNFDVIWEMHTQRGTYPVVAQKFIAAIDKGDKRIIIIDGEPFGHVLVRTPKDGSIRGNMAAGGSTHVAPLSPREHEIATAVGKSLKENDIIFAGIDVIGDYLIEINITSPTGLRQISKECGVDVAALIMQKILEI
ncbi:MAG: Glutathione synthetase [Micavibrio sp.]|nr:Glutathione synthetase [Micavibrio sp.]